MHDGMKCTKLLSQRLTFLVFGSNFSKTTRQLLDFSVPVAVMKSCLGVAHTDTSTGSHTCIVHTHVNTSLIGQHNSLY